MIEFVLPTAENKNDVLDFYAEFENNNETCIGFNLHDNYELWLKQMQNRHGGVDLPEGYVRENFYLCHEKGKMVGVFQNKLFDEEENVFVERYVIDLK